MRNNIYIILVIMALNHVGCEKLIEGPEDDPGNYNTVVVVTTLSQIQESVFNTSCALAGCHNGTNNPNLIDGQSYGSLVNVPSFEQPSLLRVKPNDSANSLLIKKLTGTGTIRMPQAPRPALAPATIDSIAAWIDRGALNN